MFFKKKSGAQKVTENRELIEENAKSIGALIVLANGNVDTIGELKDLQARIKYLIPSQEPKVVDCDKKIKSLLGDLRIALTKSDGEDSKKTAALIRDIKVVVEDRKTRV